ncbi:52 kDa repressor of the inhibitor of the kinase-like [Pelobates cultripes]|uniref:52 kDa repressor of the inhibitor of the kinase-like n=1 Tax=Pelobates cultripes TaxID=61616 RepID=A0AAD1T447_PELCU|nr:52 kDa repressor of the inhibitor of the kinase-like [Pelobates cultripes]
MSQKRVNSRTIDSFFSTSAKKSTGAQPVLESTSTIETDTSFPSCSGTHVEPIPSQTDSVLPLSVDTPPQTGSILMNDIGTHLGKTIDDFTKCLLLENPWHPPPGYELPFSVQNMTSKNGEARTIRRYLSKQHIDSFPWLVYSAVKKGLFCKYCALFAQHRKGGHNKGMALGKLVTEPLTNFKKLKGKEGDLEVHARLVYHQESVTEGKAFLKTYHSPDNEIVNQINSHRLQKVKENQERIRPIIESIIFLGRQNIPLRGHRDDGALMDDSTPDVNEGNFRELLRYRVSSGDKMLEKHLLTASSRATYISKSTQNDLIKCCGDEICNIIVGRIKEACYFSVIFDETTDISHIEQLSLNFRYVYNGSIREDFIKFVDAYEFATQSESGLDSSDSELRLTGQVLGQMVIQLIKDLSLDITHCVGIGTDSCSVMSSEVAGAVSEIIRAAPNSCRCPCYNHSLNNSISKSSQVSTVRNAVAVVKSTISFFNQSAKRHFVLKQELGSQLTSLCETRWVERHDSLIRFRDGLVKVVSALSAISQWKCLSSSSSASSLIHSLCSAEFIFSLISLINVLKVTLPLSRFLQSPTLDLTSASECLNVTMRTLENMRCNADRTFSTLHMEATELASELGVELKLPRLVGRQVHRSNYNAGSTEEFYRKSLYIPLLDNIINDLKARLPENSMQCFQIQILYL